MTQETLVIDRLGSHGDGLATTSLGRVAIPRTAPGDALTARIALYKGHVTATNITLETPGPGRRNAPCPHFDGCGGCSLQHLNDATYQDFKRSLIMDAMIAHGMGDHASRAIKPLITIPAHTRRRVNFKIKKTKNTLMLGYHRPKSNDIIPISACLLLTEGIAALIDPFKIFLADFMAPGESADLFLLESAPGEIDGLLSFNTRSSLTLESRESVSFFVSSNPFARFQIHIGGDVDFIMQQRPPMVVFGGIRVPVSAGCFLQSSAAADSILADLVLAAFYDLKPGGKVMDLFCGRGTLTFPLIAAGFSVVAIDNDGSAISALKQGAGGAEFRALTIRSQNLFQDPLKPHDIKGISAVLLDPPRAGARAQIQELSLTAVPVICMVSCNPQTFARDAKTLIDGGYILETLTPIDQFLYSAHVEIVARFRHGTGM